MTFQTTVDSGKVNVQTLPNGEIDVYGATPRYTALRKKSGALFWLVLLGQFFIFMISVMIALAAGSSANFFALVAGICIVSFIFLKMKTNTKWFSIVPNQGVKLYDGSQVAFSDINTIFTRQAGSYTGLLINVRGKELQLAIAEPSEIDYIRQVFEGNSSVRFV